jgi:hypothetical protein
MSTTKTVAFKPAGTRGVAGPLATCEPFAEFVAYRRWPQGKKNARWLINHLASWLQDLGLQSLSESSGWMIPLIAAGREPAVTTGWHSKGPRHQLGRGPDC